MLVATAAVSLIAPIAAQASDFNIEGIDTYVRKKSTSRKQKQFNSNSFDNDLATLEEKVDSSGIEIKGFNAGSFSDTTVMDGKVIGWVGAVDGAKDIDYDEDQSLADETQTDSVGTGYTFTMNLNTSFTGDDNLYVRLKGGDSFLGMGLKPGTYHIEKKDTNEDFNVDKIWYQFPVGDNVTVFAGPRIENYYMYVTPSVYKPGALKAFKLGGNSNFGASTDFGFGAKWELDNGFAIAANAVDKNADGIGWFQSSGNDNGTGDSVNKFDTQFAFTKSNYHISVTRSDQQNWTSQQYNATALAEDTATDAVGYAYRAYWVPPEYGTLVPSVSLGYDTKDWENGVDGTPDEANSWMIGLNWKDSFRPDDVIGMAVTQPLKVTDLVGGDLAGGITGEVGDPLIWEAYYSWKVNDSMSLTPAIFGGNNTWEHDDDIFGAVLTSAWKF